MFHFCSDMEDANRPLANLALRAIKYSVAGADCGDVKRTWDHIRKAGAGSRAANIADVPSLNCTRRNLPYIQVLVAHRGWQKVGDAVEKVGLELGVIV